MAGDIARPQLEGLVGSPDWPQLDQPQRQKAVDRVMKDARSVLLPSLLGRGSAPPKGIAPGLAGNPDAWRIQDETVR